MSTPTSSDQTGTASPETAPWTPTLRERRLDELDALVESHLEGGSLDEGNGDAFDRLVDTWLAEELARIDAEIAAARHRQALDEHARAERAHRDRVALAQEEERRQRMYDERRRERQEEQLLARRRQAQSTQDRLERERQQSALRGARARRRLDIEVAVSSERAATRRAAVHRLDFVCQELAARKARADEDLTLAARLLLGTGVQSAARAVAPPVPPVAEEVPAQRGGPSMEALASPLEDSDSEVA